MIRAQHTYKARILTKVRHAGKTSKLREHTTNHIVRGTAQDFKGLFARSQKLKCLDRPCPHISITGESCIASPICNRARSWSPSRAYRYAARACALPGSRGSRARSFCSVRDNPCLKSIPGLFAMTGARTGDPQVQPNYTGLGANFQGAPVAGDRLFVASFEREYIAQIQLRRG